MIDKDLIDLEQSLDTSSQSSDLLQHLLTMDPYQDIDEGNESRVITEPETSDSCDKTNVSP